MGNSHVSDTQLVKHPQVAETAVNGVPTLQTDQAANFVSSQKCILYPF